MGSNPKTSFLDLAPSSGHRFRSQKNVNTQASLTYTTSVQTVSSYTTMIASPYLTTYVTTKQKDASHVEAPTLGGCQRLSTFFDPRSQGSVRVLRSVGLCRVVPSCAGTTKYTIEQQLNLRNYTLLLATQSLSDPVYCPERQ